jgi:hypothetical protein
MRPIDFFNLAQLCSSRITSLALRGQSQASSPTSGKGAESEIFQEMTYDLQLLPTALLHEETFCMNKLSGRTNR